jgi:hypothetical protein
MAYDEVLAHRIREAAQDATGLTEKPMFGGLAFLVGGHMAVAASGQGGILVRVDPVRSGALVDPPDVDRAVMRGRAMDGWLRVTESAVDADEDLRRWVDIALAYVRTLPAT